MFQMCLVGHDASIIIISYYRLVSAWASNVSVPAYVGLSKGSGSVPLPVPARVSVISWASFILSRLRRT